MYILRSIFIFSSWFLQLSGFDLPMEVKYAESKHDKQLRSEGNSQIGKEGKQAFSQINAREKQGLAFQT